MQETDATDGLALNRRTAMKGGLAGLGLLALTGSAAASNGADKIYVSGSTREEHTLDAKVDGNTSEAFTLASESIELRRRPVSDGADRDGAVDERRVHGGEFGGQRDATI